MKPSRLIALLLFAVTCAAAQTHLIVQLDELNMNPATNRQATVTKLQPVRGNGTTYYSTTNTWFAVSNIAAGDWELEVKQRGSADGTRVNFYIKSTSLGVIGVHTNLSVAGAQTHPTTGKTAWSIAASEARYAPIGSTGGTNSVPDNVLTNNQSTAVTFGSSVAASSYSGGSANISAISGVTLTASGGISGPGTGLTAIPANQLASGTVPTARLGSGTANSSTYLRGDQTWAAAGASAAEVAAIMNTNGMRVFNVVNYGADPLGVKWSATNIQQAISAATNAGGGIVYFPYGRYALGEDLGSPGYIVEEQECAIAITGNNIVLKGESMGGAEIFGPTSGGTFRNMLGSSRNTNVAVMDLTLNGNNCTEFHDLTQFHTNSYVWFERVHFKNSLSNEGCDTDGSYNVWVRDCVFSDNGGGGIGFGGPPTGGGNWFISNCKVNRGGTNDGGAVEDSGAIVVKPDWGLVTIENCVVENAPVILTSAASSAADVRVTNLRGLPSGVAGTNVFHSSGSLTLNDCYFYHTNQAGFFIYGGNDLSINNSFFNGRPALYSDNKVRTSVTDSTFGSSLATHNIQMRGGGFHKFANNHFDSGGYSGVRFMTAPVTNSLVEGNIFNGCDMVIDGGSSNNMVLDNLFRAGSYAIYGSSKWNKFVNNDMANSGTVTVGSGSSQNIVKGSRIYNITFDSAQDWVFENCYIGGTIGGAASYNSSTFINPRDLTGQPLRNYTITTNYTADSVDSIMVFNGSSVTSTIPSAVTLNRRKQFTIKNINATALEITNATGAQTFDGALRLRLQQNDSVTLMSDGANWKVVERVESAPKFYVRNYGAIPNDGICDLVAIQSAIDAADLAVATNKYVICEAGNYDLNPDNIVYEDRLSEGHPSCLTIWSNNLTFVGAGSYATSFRLMKVRGGGTQIAILGSGCDTPYIHGASNVVLQGFNLNANNLYAECTQIYRHTNWVISDVGVMNTTTGCDGFDTQNGFNMRAYNCWAKDIAENAWGTQDVDLIVDGLIVTRAGMSGSLGAAFQTSTTAPLFKNVVATELNCILTYGNSCNFQNCYFASTNTSTSFTNFIFNAGNSATLRDVTIVSPTVNGAAMIWVNGGTLIADGLVADNNKPIIRVTSGSIDLENCKLGISGGRIPLSAVTATKIRLYNNIFFGNSGSSDASFDTGPYLDFLVQKNRFIGGIGVYVNSGATHGGTLWEGNVIEGVLTVTLGPGARLRNNEFRGGVTHAGSTPTFDGNYFGGSFNHTAGGAPVMVGGNVFTNGVFGAGTTLLEVQETFATPTAITATSTQTLWTNSQPFNVTVYFRGGAIEAVGKNGTQIYGTSTTGNSVDLSFAEWVGITNSSTSGEVINWLPKR